MGVIYTIKSESEEGVYYLSSNWRKNKSLWVTEDEFKERMFFKTINGAKKSLSSLLKVMSDYEDDKFTVVDKDFNYIDEI